MSAQPPDRPIGPVESICRVLRVKRTDIENAAVAMSAAQLGESSWRAMDELLLVGLATLKAAGYEFNKMPENF